jgi:filamentous hemagglutinin
LQDQLKQATTPQEKEKVQQDIKDVNMQERALNILVGAVSGFGASSVTKEGLAAAADEMRDLMVEDSKKFAGVTDGKTVLSNASGTSEGINGNTFKVGGTRVDLDLLCGVSNERCKTVTDQSGVKVLDLNSKGQVQFDEKAAGMTMAQFLTTSEGKQMSGATGGIQGEKGTLFGVPYAAGSWQDKLVESFAGTHDFIGGKVSGLYDEQGNATRGRSELATTLQNRWSEVAILPSAPFAAAQGLPPEVWKAIAILLGAGK